MKKSIKKLPKFKVGDLAIVTSNKYGHEFEIGQTVKIKRISIIDEYECYSLDGKDRWFLSIDEIKPIDYHPLIITKQTKVRAGKKYYTWQMSKNKKVVNHQYNQPGTRNKQLNTFLDDIKNGNYIIK